MRRAFSVLFLSAACLAVAGPSAIGTLALRLGWDRPAVAILQDAAARGVALYRLGDHAAADAAFARAGRSQTFNRALSLAATGDYQLSVAYFDAVLFVNPADEEARAGRDLVASMYDPHRGDSTAPGRIMGHGGLSAPDEEIQAALTGAAAEYQRRPLDARGLAASDEWLQSLTDDPGEFLRLRIHAEYDRRAQLGLIRPEAQDPW
jgi:Ca-activated chloride channel homolog